jgi:hypothetical protein
MKKQLLLMSAIAVGLTLGSSAPAWATSSQADVRQPFCSLTVNYPHASVHASGTINVTATTSCPDPMTSIYIDTELWRTAPTAGQWWNGFGVTKYASKSATDNQATSCVSGPGTFRGSATARIVPPPGYTLSSSPYDSKYGASIALACGASKWMTSVPVESVVVLIEYEAVQ